MEDSWFSLQMVRKDLDKNSLIFEESVRIIYLSSRSLGSLNNSLLISYYSNFMNLEDSDGIHKLIVY